MARKDPMQDYYEKLERIANLKEKGLIGDDEYLNEKNKLDRLKPKPASVLANIIAFIFLIIIGLLVLAVVISGTSEKSKDLDLSVKTSTLQIQLKNNEQVELGNCTVDINSGYRSTVAVSVDPLEYPLASFEKSNGERFNPLTHSVKKIVVSNCAGQPNSMGFYYN